MIRLTIKLRQTICAFIRAGAFAQVAAAAAGVPPEVFADWLERGQRSGAREPYRSFAAEVQQAIAQARVSAEMNVLHKAPATWLRNGPGRESAEQPGWTTTARPVSRRDSRSMNVLLDPGMQRVLTALLRVLEPYPEARAAVARALSGVKTDKGQTSSGEPAGG